jgi:hypothetical protein
MAVRVKPDIVIYDIKNNPIMIIEVKRQHNIDDEWVESVAASQLRAYALQSSVSFFLLATPARFYVWKREDLLTSETPRYIIDATFLKPDFERVGVHPTAISEAGFTLMVMSFIYKLTQSEELPKELQTNSDWLVESGLFHALQGADVTLEPDL